MAPSSTLLLRPSSPPLCAAATALRILIPQQLPPTRDPYARAYVPRHLPPPPLHPGARSQPSFPSSLPPPPASESQTENAAERVAFPELHWRTSFSHSALPCSNRWRWKWHPASAGSTSGISSPAEVAEKYGRTCEFDRYQDVILHLQHALTWRACRFQG